MQRELSIIVLTRIFSGRITVQGKKQTKYNKTEIKRILSALVTSH
jgi:hypothetical protein